MKKRLNVNFFPYGTQYYRAPTPLPGEWERDLKEIARAGYTHVQFRPQWRVHERVFDRFVWDDLDRLMDLAQAVGLRAVVKPMAECAPDWVYTELHGERIGFSGIPIPPIAHGAFYVGGWLPCFDNPDVAERAANFAFHCADKYKNHPALWFYDAWNEPRSRPAGQCHCPHSRESYRRWLRDRFGTIEKLNAEYGKEWTDFDTVMPPESAADYAELYLWRQWAAWAVSEHVRNIVDAIKRAHPEAPVLNHVGMSSVVSDSVCDSSNDLQNAAVSDFYGTSFWIDLHPKTLPSCREGDLVGDWLRRVDPDFWIHEFYTAQGPWTRPCEPDMVKFLAWQGIATGACGFTYWQFRSERLGNETNGYGMREINGDPTPRSRAADHVAAVLRDFGWMLAGTRRQPSPVAMLYDKNCDLVSRIQCINDSFMAEGTGDPGMNFYQKAVQAAHVLYDRLPAGLDFITADDDLSERKCVIVAAAEILPAGFCRRLREFVENGGVLILEYPFAVRDENTWAAPERPNNGMAELTGFREKLRWVPEGETATVDGRAVADQRWYTVGEIAADAEIFGRWSTGEAAAIRRRAGKGVVLTLLASPSLAYSASRSPEAFAVAESLLESVFPGELLPPGLEVRTRSSAEHRVTMLFNTGSDDAVSWRRPAGRLLDGAGMEETSDGGLVLRPHGFGIFAE